MTSSNIFPSFYLAPIQYYFHLLNNSYAHIDVYENFVKQSYRNRCCILSPNGIQNLTIPVVKARKKQRYIDVKISYAENWKKMHWRSLEAAYRSSPYFEFYEDELFPFYHEKKYDFLIDLNWNLEEKIIELIGIKIDRKKTEKYIPSNEKINDYRTSISPKIQAKKTLFKQYVQVFGDRTGFAPNLSIVDLLFNEGPNASNYIQQLQLNV